MATIDERIVSMVFENAKFEAGAAKTMATLAKLEDSLKKIGQNNATASLDNIEKSANKVTLQGPLNALDKLRGRLFGSGRGAAEGMSQIEAAGNKVQLEQPVRALDKVQAKTANVGAQAADGFNQIEQASNRVSLQGLNSAMDSVTSKFSVMQGAASVAMGNITSQAAMKGANFAKSFAVGPLQQGFSEYQTNLGSIQTILANTEGQKVSGLDNVNKSLGELNTYSDQTIYNFSEMAKNIGTFTAAGVDLPRATSSIKGIANLAALSGSNSQQASTAMYQLSQAISAGRVGLQDWNSVVNAGMGGAVFQKSLMRTAENMGALEKGAVKIDKATGKATVNGESFRNSIMAKPGEESWLSSDVLTKTLEQMTGDMSDAELKAQGFSDAQIKAIQKQASNAKDAATQVKTLPQVWDVARETIGSGWAQTSQLIFGNFKEAKKTFTELSNTVNGVINRMSKARNHVLKIWKDMGGRKELIEGLKTTFNVLNQILHAVSSAFRSVFPKKTGKDLYEFTKGFTHLAEKLQSFVLQNKGALRNTFAGFFAVLHIGMAIVKGVAGVIGDLLGVVGHGSGGFLTFTAHIGLFLANLDKVLTRGGALKNFFNGISSALQKPMQLIGHFTSGISKLFGGSAGATSMNKVTGAAGPMTSALHKLKSAWDGFVGMLKQAKSLISPWLDKIGDALSHIGDVFKSAFSDKNLGKTTAIIQTAFLAGIFVAIRKAIFGGISQLGGAVKGLSGVLGGVKDVLGGLTGQLQAMQHKVQAQTLLTIAGAVGILAAATFVLAKIPADQLAKAMSAIAVGLGEVFVAMKMATGGSFGKGKSLAVIATGMILISSSVLILAAAMKVMSTMNWEEIGKGLVGMGASMRVLASSIALMPKGGLMMAQAAALVVLSTALVGLGIAMKIFASMSWVELARGLAGVMFSLVALIEPMWAFIAMGPQLLLAAPALVGIAFAMELLGTAVKIFASIDPKAMLTGLIGMAASMLILSEAIWFMPPGPYLIAQAAGMVILAGAMSGIAVALAMFGGLGIGQIVKGLFAMGASLVVLGTGLIFMEESLPGAAALLVAAAGIAILAPALGFIGSLKIMTIVKGLAAIAAVLAVLALAGLYAAPGLDALGMSLIPLAGVLFGAAAATFLFAKALEIMGGAGAKGVGVMIAAITAFVLMLPNWIITLLKGVLDITKEIAKILPGVLDALGVSLDKIIAWVQKSAPKLALAIGVLVDSILLVLLQNVPKIIDAGAKLLLAFLTGLAKNIGPIVTNASLVVTRFLTALAAQAPNLVNAGAKMLGSFLTGIGQKAAGLAAKAANIVLRFIAGIASKIPELLTIGSKLIANLVLGIGQHAARMVTAGVNAIIHFLTGLGNAAGRLIRKGIEIAGKFIHGVATGLVRLADVGAQAIIDFLNGMAEVIRTRGKEIRDAGWNLADAIMDGMVAGLKEAYNRLPGPVKGMIHVVTKTAKFALKSKSPSKVFHEIGGFIVQGLANGISESSIAEKSMANTADNVIQAGQKMRNVSGLLDGVMDVDPTITPILDLSQVKKEAGTLGDITKVPPIKATGSIGQALAISSEKARIDNDSLAAVAAGVSDKPAVHYEQTINSPEPLSTAEIYRRTNNTLSKIRKDVGLQ